MKALMLAMVVMAVVPPAFAAPLLVIAILGWLLGRLANTQFPTFETLTANRAMARAADPRLAS